MEASRGLENAVDEVQRNTVPGDIGKAMVGIGVENLSIQTPASGIHIRDVDDRNLGHFSSPTVSWPTFRSKLMIKCTG